MTYLTLRICSMMTAKMKFYNSSERLLRENLQIINNLVILREALFHHLGLVKSQELLVQIFLFTNTNKWHTAVLIEEAPSRK